MGSEIHNIDRQPRRKRVPQWMQKRTENSEGKEVDQRKEKEVQARGRKQ